MSLHALRVCCRATTHCAVQVNASHVVHLFFLQMFLSWNGCEDKSFICEKRLTYRVNFRQRIKKIQQKRKAGFQAVRGWHPRIPSTGDSKCTKFAHLPFRCNTIVLLSVVRMSQISQNLQEIRRWFWASDFASSAKYKTKKVRLQHEFWTESCSQMAVFCLDTSTNKLFACGGHEYTPDCGSDSESSMVDDDTTDDDAADEVQGVTDSRILRNCCSIWLTCHKTDKDCRNSTFLKPYSMYLPFSLLLSHVIQSAPFSCASEMPMIESDSKTTRNFAHLLNLVGEKLPFVQSNSRKPNANCHQWECTHSNRQATSNDLL